MMGVMSALKVFHVLASDTVGGGADEHTMLLCRDEQEMGMRVGLVAVEGPILDEARRNGWPAFAFERHYNRHSLGALADLFRRERPDVVHTHKPLADLVGCRAAAAARVPVIVATIHVRLNTERAIRSRRFLKVIPLRVVRTRILCRIPQRLVAVSESTRRDALSKLAVPPERVVTVHNGTDVARYRPLEGFERAAVRLGLGCPAGVPLIGVVARVVDVKGHHVLLEALPSILSAVPDAHVVFVGKTDDTAYVKRLEEMAERFGVAGRVHLTGTRRDIPEVLNALDVFVLPSHVEGLSRAALEAMACGVPVVASDTDGNREAMTHGVNALLVQPGDAGALGSEIQRVLRGRSLAERLGAEGRRTVVERFDSRRAAERQVRLYEEILSAGPNPV